MGNCCSSEPSCNLTRSEIDPINSIAHNCVTSNSPLPLAAPYVAKIIRGKTKCQFSELAERLQRDTVPVNTYNIDGLDSTPVQQLKDPMRSLMSAVAGEVNRQAKQSMMPAIMNKVQGGDPKNDKQITRCAETSLLKACEAAVLREVSQILVNHRQEIESFQSSSFSPGSTRRAGSTAMGVGGPRMSDNNNSSVRGSNPQNPGNNGGIPYSASAQYGGVNNNNSNQNQQNNNSREAAYHNNNNVTPQRNQYQGHGDDSPIDHQHGYSGSQQQFYDSVTAFEQQHQSHQEEEVASPTNEAWSRYPIPEENGPWVPVNEAFYWSENAELYYFPAAGHFFHPESEMWYDPNTGKWMDEAEHEKLLEQMAAQGLY